MGPQSSYFSLVFGHPDRAEIIVGCPALALLCYRHVVAAMSTGSTIHDPFASSSTSRDEVSDLLAVQSVSELISKVFSEPQQQSPLWSVIRTALEESSRPQESGRDPNAVLRDIDGIPHFSVGSSVGGIPLSSGSLQNAVDMSRRVLRSATTCALAGSSESLPDSRLALKSILQFSRIVPMRGAAEVTSEGINFCMMSLQQQWWVLVSGALDRVLALTQQQQPSTATGHGAVTLPRLWQLLAVLAAMDSVQFMHGFPERASDPTGYHVVGRLSEVGLVYPVKTAAGDKCFVLSPHFQHALEWQATAPICLSSMLGGDGGSGSSGDPSYAVRREDTDTIITETNFRLYAYTRNHDLLHILDQFAIREEVVQQNLVCYRLTRNSFADALRKGISAIQVLKFLSLRAHPSMLHKYGEDAHAAIATTTPQQQGASSSTSFSSSSWAVPQSVCDQLLMWESECNRVTFTRPVVMLRGMTDEQQQYVEKFLGDMGKADAIMLSEAGTCVVRQEVYDMFIAGAVPEE